MEFDLVFIENANKEQVVWWNKIGRWLIRVVNLVDIVETTTGKKIGIVFAINGLLSKYVIAKANEFQNITSTILK